MLLKGVAIGWQVCVGLHQSFSQLLEWSLLSLLPESHFGILWFISGLRKRLHFPRMPCTCIFAQFHSITLYGNSDGCGLSCWVKSFKCDLHFRFFILPNVPFVTVTFFDVLFNYLSLVIINSGIRQSYCKSLFLEKLPFTCHVYHSGKRKLGNEHIESSNDSIKTCGTDPNKKWCTLMIKPTKGELGAPWIIWWITLCMCAWN